MKYPIDQARMRLAAFITVLLSATAPAPTHAQQRVTIETLLPDSVIQRVIDIYNRPQTTRLNGDSRLAAGTSLTGDVAVLNGTLEIGGRVTGDVVGINGDIHILAGANISGTVTMAGGSIEVDDGAAIGGSVRAYRETLRLRMDGERIEYAPKPEDSGLAASRDFAVGRTDILVAVHGAYNRVEGLPIAVGPRFHIGDGTRVQGIGIYRTATGFDAAKDRFGYVFTAEHRIDALHIDASVFREITSIEDWDISNREATLAAFVLHQDYRDHYEHRGWTIGASMHHEGEPYSIGITYRDETDRSVIPRDPFTILHNDDAWRAEPLVAEGRLHTLRGVIEYDTRNDVANPTDGWRMRGAIEQGLGGSLFTRAETALPFMTGQDRFTTALVDIRRYARLTPYSHLALRIRMEGALDSREAGLPPQRQLTLGGEGSLPAYPIGSFDCGASRSVMVGSNTFNAFHGCDRAVLSQVEYQAGFPLARRLGERLGLGSWLTNSVKWAAFFDAGRAWNPPESRNGRGHGRDDFSVDAGLGVRLGPVGIYWAVPLSGSAHEYNFFMRLGPRF